LRGRSLIMDGSYEMPNGDQWRADAPMTSDKRMNPMSVLPAIPVEVANLTRAFEKGELLLHYQPQVDVSHRWPKIVGYEALARWPLSDGSFVSPDRFIPVAEDCGFVLTLDIWVIETVCKELARMKAAGALQCLGMSANVSPQQFGQRHFSQSVADILTYTGIDPSCLTLEITERTVLDEDAPTLENIHALREMGVTLSLDDFGTGYSSLFQLRTLPIHEVKLDRSFVSGIPHRHQDTAILSATIDLASDLGLRVVAEGVERSEQVEWLRERGCHAMQGFLYGRPAARKPETVIL